MAFSDSAPPDRHRRLESLFCGVFHLIPAFFFPPFLNNNPARHLHFAPQDHRGATSSCGRALRVGRQEAGGAGLLSSSTGALVNSVDLTAEWPVVPFTAAGVRADRSLDVHTADSVSTSRPDFSLFHEERRPDRKAGPRQE